MLSVAVIFQTELQTTLPEAVALQAVEAPEGLVAAGWVLPET
jgi:hypothetical protein